MRIVMILYNNRYYEVEAVVEELPDGTEEVVLDLTPAENSYYNVSSHELAFEDIDLAIKFIEDSIVVPIVTTAEIGASELQNVASTEKERLQIFREICDEYVSPFRGYDYYWD